jgi:hypothetical protein
MAFPGTQTMNVELTPYFDRLSPSMAAIMRGDFRDHQFTSKLASHEVLRVGPVASRISSGYENSLLQYLIVKNLSQDDAVIVTLQLNEYPADLTRISIPPGGIAALRDVNYGAYVPDIACAAGAAEVEVLFFAYTTASQFRGEYLQFSPAELTWVKSEGEPQ